MRGVGGSGNGDERLADWVDGRMTPRELERFEAEMRVNPALRAAAEEYRQTVSAVQTALRSGLPKVDLAAAVLAALANGPGAGTSVGTGDSGDATAATGTMGSPTAHGGEVARRRWLWPTVASAAVAAGLLVTVLTMHRLGSPSAPETRHVASNPAATGIAADTATDGSDHETNAKADGAGPAREPGFDAVTAMNKLAGRPEPETDQAGKDAGRSLGKGAGDDGRFRRGAEGVRAQTAVPVGEAQTEAQTGAQQELGRAGGAYQGPGAPPPPAGAGSSDFFLGASRKEGAGGRPVADPGAASAGQARAQDPAQQAQAQQELAQTEAMRMTQREQPREETVRTVQPSDLMAAWAAQEKQQDQQLAETERRDAPAQPPAPATGQAGLVAGSPIVVPQVQVVVVTRSLDALRGPADVVPATPERSAEERAAQATARDLLALFPSAQMPSAQVQSLMTRAQQQQDRSAQVLADSADLAAVQGLTLLPLESLRLPQTADVAARRARWTGPVTAFAWQFADGGESGAPQPGAVDGLRGWVGNRLPDTQPQVFGAGAGGAAPDARAFAAAIAEVQALVGNAALANVLHVTGEREDVGDLLRQVGQLAQEQQLTLALAEVPAPVVSTLQVASEALQPARNGEPTAGGGGGRGGLVPGSPAGLATPGPAGPATGGAPGAAGGPPAPSAPTEPSPRRVSVLLMFREQLAPAVPPATTPAQTGRDRD